jgi:hypothetical protein
VRPLKPEEKRSILERFPPELHDEIVGDIEEYQSLLSARLRRDPETHASPAAALRAADEAERIRSLRRRLFGPIVEPQSSGTEP